jgi:hypothetical protein
MDFLVNEITSLSIEKNVCLVRLCTHLRAIGNGTPATPIILPQRKTPYSVALPKHFRYCKLNRCNKSPRCSVYSATRKEKSKSKHSEESRRGDVVYQLAGLHLDLSSSWHGSPPAASLSAAFFFMRSSCACVRPPRTGAASGTGGIVQVGGVIVLPLQTS